MAEKLTLNTKVEYKKRRHPRAFKVWDSAVLGAIMVHSAEVKAKILEASEKTGKPVAELDKTLIDTELLYLIVDGNLDLYKKLLNESLIKTGNNKTNPNVH